ncbi:MAG: 50S ribosomal protein L9 [Bdellovibrionales bacterium]|nr:50S ribosomal protein L9 [Bdellovibrionales bacterium]
MKVVLKTDVKNLGKVGEVVRVKDGFARNFLFPRNLAQEATEKRVKELAHLMKMAEAQKKKALLIRKEVLDKVAGVTVTLKVAAGENDKLFGAVTNVDLAASLENEGISIDRRDIHLDEPIKILGQHKAIVKFGEGLETELKISVERA